MKNNNDSLQARLARITLDGIKSRGHPYVDLRKDGKRFVFFCTLCLSPCYSDNVLLDHLNGGLHKRRLPAARRTLLKPNPWPFDDGVSFFDCTDLFVKKTPPTNSNKKLTSLSLVPCDKNLPRFELDHHDLIIPGVLILDRISDLKVKFIGTGRVAARCKENESGETVLHRTWCEWLGVEKNPQGSHDYGIVAFSYNNHLGRVMLDDLDMLQGSETAEDQESYKKPRSFSDPGHATEFTDSSEEEASSSLEWTTRSLPRETIRQDVRMEHWARVERTCDICQQKMLPQKDAGALLNTKTGKLVCSSRNNNGAFHVFHVSCLLHWIILCESESARKQSNSPKMKRSRKRKTNTAEKESVGSVFCAECQGTGVLIKGNEFENPVYPLSEIFKLKIKIGDGRHAWMKDPEELVNCSTGFCFSSNVNPDEEEKIMQLNLIQFYRAVWY